MYFGSRLLRYGLLFSALCFGKQLNAQNYNNTATGGGTVILTYITNDSIVMAADSRHGVMDTFGHYSLSKLCKIKITNNIAYAFSGSVDYVNLDNRKVLYNAYTIIAACIKQKKYLKPAVDLFIDTMKHSIIPGLMVHLSQVALNKLKENYGFFLQISVVCFYNNEPFYQCGDFVIEFEGSKFTHVDYHKNMIPPSNIYRIGLDDHIELYTKSHPEELKDASQLYNIMKKFIYIEANAHKNEVDSTVNIVCLKPTGINWAVKSQSCSNQ